jgi:hypothetical protein
VIPGLRLKGKVTSINTKYDTGLIEDENGKEFFFHKNYTVPLPHWLPELDQRVEFTPLPKSPTKPNPVAMAIVAI